MEPEFNFWWDNIYPIITKIIGKKYSCCNKLRNCRSCIKRNKRGR